MISPKLMKKTFLIGPVLADLLGASVLFGCASDTGVMDGRDTGGGATATQETPERGGGESGGEHGSGGEGAGGEGGGESGAFGSEEGSGANLSPDETFDAVRSSARLILNYDASSNSFTGTVENTTNSVLDQVRIEVHLSNGTELGPTAPVDLAPGQVMDVNLPSTAASFTGWMAHAEVGSGAEGSQASGESGGSESGPDGPEAPRATEPAMKPRWKPPCPAPSSLSENRGTAFLAGWPFPPSTMQQPGPSTQRCKTPPRRRSATCRPNHT